MNLNFELVEKVWWRPEYYSFTNKELIKNIMNYIKKGKKFVNEISLINNVLISEFDYYYRIIYLRECLIGERNISADLSFEYIESVVQNSTEIKDYDENIPFERKEKEIKKIRNVYQAVLEVFPNLIFPKLDMKSFTPWLSNSIHSKIAEGLIESPGTYRKTEAKPLNENFQYMAFKNIDEEMNNLFRMTRSEMHRINEEHREINENKVEKIIKVATQF